MVRYKRKLRNQSNLNIGDFHNSKLISPPLKNANQFELAHERIGGRPCLFSIRQLFLNGQQWTCRQYEMLMSTLLITPLIIILYSHHKYIEFITVFPYLTTTIIIININIIRMRERRSLYNWTSPHVQGVAALA